MTPLLKTNADEDRQQARAAQLAADITALDKEIDMMILKQSKAPANVEDRYTRQIERASERRAILESDLKRTQATLEAPAVTRARQLAYEYIAGTGLKEFWQQAPHEVNQWLHRLMGRHRFVVQAGEIINVR